VVFGTHHAHVGGAKGGAQRLAVQVGATVGPKAPSVHKTVLEPKKPVAEQVSVQTAPEKTSESEHDDV
jgi:hypothetical protein